LKYRGRQQIYQDILESCNNELGTNRTNIMYKGMMSYGQMKDYMDDVLEKGLVEERKKRFFLTDRGREALSLLNELEMVFGDGP
jgi:predicted transcriptional regulator